MISSGGKYGAEGVILSLCQGLKEHKISPFLIGIHNTYQPHLEILDHARERGIDAQEILCRKQWDKNTIKGLQSYIKNHNIQIVHTHNYKSDFYGRAVTKGTRVKHCITSHGWTSENIKVRMYEWIDRRIMNSADKIICVSDALKKQNIRMGVRSNCLVMIPNGIDIDDYTLRVRPLEKKRIEIGVVGRLSPEKGHKILVQAIKILIQGFPNIRILFAGEGICEKELRVDVELAGLEKNFMFSGFQKDIKSFYRSIDFLIIPSLSEGLPLTLLEAMAMGVPIIASRVGDIPKVIDHEKNGILVDPARPDVLAEAMAGLIIDIKRQKEITAAARKTVENDYTSKQMCETYADLYQKLLKRFR